MQDTPGDEVKDGDNNTSLPVVVANAEGEKVVDKRDHMNVVFIGHVDAGKSTVAGNILILTGMVDQRTIEKYEKEAKDLKRDSWFLAYVLDTNEEERAKGKTVEVGRAYFSTEKRRFTILDAPGHKSYVPNMIGGATQADVAILVISARKGEYETGFERGGQTREHTILAKTLGINNLIIAINKMDESTVKWDKGRYDEIIKGLSTFLRQNGYNVKKNVIFLPISGYTGANLLKRITKDVCPWYDGPALIEILETIKLPKRNPAGPLRIPILDRYKDAGKLIITGKVELGTIKLGQSVVVMPNKEIGKVTFLGTDIDERDECGPGENVRITISSAKLENISAGFVICDEEHPLKPVSRFEAQIYVVGLLEHKPIFSKGYGAVLHVHTAVEDCSVSRLVELVDTKTGKPNGKKPQFLQLHSAAIARFTTSQPVCVETFKSCPSLGRFIIRDEGKTIVIGTISRLPGQKK